MQTPTSLFVAVATLFLGFVVLSANPGRFTNQVFFLASVLISLSTWFIFRSTLAGILYLKGQPANPVPWLRANGALTSLIPWTIWLLRESIISPGRKTIQTLNRSLLWLGLGVMMALLATTNWYIPTDSVPLHEKRGPAYVVCITVLCGACAILILRTRARLQHESGIRRIELQFFVINLGIASILSSALYATGNLFSSAPLKRFGLFVVPISYAISAWALSFYRVFDVRQVFLPLGQRLALALTFGLGASIGWRFLESQVPAPWDLVLSFGVVSAIAFPLDRVSRKWLRLGNEEAIAEWRGAVIQTAREEPNAEKLHASFEDLICRRCGSSHSHFLYDRREAHAAKALVFSHTRSGYEILCKLGWATPESLQRRRATHGLDDLRQFLNQNSLGLMVTVPRGSPTPSLILALGVKTSQWPFTYPEVQQIQNLAELMDNILTHSRLTAQAALKAKMEHLALMSRGLAHDLKNLITPVSTFIMHAEAKVEKNSVEGEVHRAAKRSLHLMDDYVRDALFFASRLSANFRPIELHKILETVRELTSDRATHRRVEVVIASETPFSLTADGVLLQRLLGNLVNNAIDASNAESKVTLRCSQGNEGAIRIEVADQGCGIAADNLKRIFDPYFTTKQFGDDIRGFGLGLTICEKIVALHQGKISVHSEVDRGTSVLVDLPAMPSAFGAQLDATAPA